MTILLPTLAVAFGALCVWLTVRIVNRRERWAKWTLADVVGVPVLYVLSFGPPCWIATRVSGEFSDAPLIYRPLTWTFKQSRVGFAIQWYTELAAADGWRWYPDIGVEETAEGNTVADRWGLRHFP
ncbi:MAG: hypothetical protein HY290_15555 [Planctomycetia bacterium]|nr:hypothetical protein [Planctomycetia bacterium]